MGMWPRSGPETLCPLQAFPSQPPPAILSGSLCCARAGPKILCGSEAATSRMAASSSSTSPKCSVRKMLAPCSRASRNASAASLVRVGGGTAPAGGGADSDDAAHVVRRGEGMAPCPAPSPAAIDSSRRWGTCTARRGIGQCEQPLTVMCAVAGRPITFLSARHSHTLPETPPRGAGVAITPGAYVYTCAPHRPTAGTRHAVPLAGGARRRAIHPACDGRGTADLRTSTPSWLRPRDTRLGKEVIARKREFHSSYNTYKRRTLKDICLRRRFIFGSELGGRSVQ